MIAADFLTKTVAAAVLALALTVRAPAQDVAALETERAASAIELQRISRAMTVSQERALQIEAEIAAIRKDHASLSAALVQAAKTERKLNQDIADIAFRLEGLDRQRRDLVASLDERRGVLAEVLGALQRMGLNPRRRSWCGPRTRSPRCARRSCWRPWCRSSRARPRC